MANLNTQNIGTNFKGILNLGATINTPLSTTLQAITDGDGVASPLMISTTEVAVRGTTNAQRLIIDADAGVGKLLSFRSGNIQRWAIRVDGTESGANAGADIAIRRYDDAGTFIDAPITLARSSGFITIGKRTSFTGSTGTSLLNFPDAGTTAADGISFGTNISLFRTASEALRLNSTTFELFSPTNNRVSHWFSSGGRLRLINNIGGGTTFFDFDSGAGSSIIEYGNSNSLQFRTAGTSRFEISSTSTGSQVNITPSTLTGSSATSALSIAQTANTTGVFDMFAVNLTNTASGAGSNFINLKNGGSSQFSVGIFGAINIQGAITSPGLQGYRFQNQGTFTSPSDGVFLFRNSALNDFNRLQFGGSTNLFPSHKRVNATIETRLADDSGFAATQSLYQRFGTGSPEGVVTAPIGARYSRTDGGAGTSFYVKESGTGNTGWVAK